MKLGGWSTRILAALGLVIYTAGVFAAPLSIGFVAPDEEPRYTNLLLGLRQGLDAAGVGAKNVHIAEYRVPRGNSAKALNAAQSLSAGRVRVVFVVGTELTKAVRSAAKELPIVFITPGDPVRAGLAASLAHPGNNLTHQQAIIGTERRTTRGDRISSRTLRPSLTIFSTRQNECWVSGESG